MIRRGQSWARLRPLAAGLGLWATALPASAAAPGVVPVTCTNPHSGSTWQISIDYDKKTVDSYPATISAAKISWHDTKDGGNYTLDRSSGALTEIVASSTGGYFLYHQCALKNAG